VTTLPIRPRRSVLYMPGSNARALEKARTLAADALIFDLEDAVAPSAKVAARNNVTQAIATGGYGRREILVRVNGLDSAWGVADATSIAGVKPDGVVIPKIESAAQVLALQSLLDQTGAHRDLPLWCMIETPRGVLRAEEIAGASPRVAGLIMGTSDLAKELGAAHTPSRLPMLTSLGLCLIVARAYEKVILDGVHLDLDDDAGFAAACLQGREFGFDGKTLIHPKTIATANEVFAPSTAEVAWAHRIIGAHTDAARDGIGVVLVDGKLIENLHVAAAHRVVALAKAIIRAEQS
jgi:citrate lyase subunit beta / citryl-CoA lyase